MRGHWAVFRRILYGMVLTALAVFLILQGADPWREVLEHWVTLAGVMLVTTLSLGVQAQTFRHCLPPEARRPAFKTTFQAWAIGGLSGMVAPLFAGLAVRTGILRAAGVGVEHSVMAAARQSLFNVEYALLVAAIVLVIRPWPEYPWLGLAALAVWLVWLVGRHLARSSRFMLPNALRAHAQFLMSAPSWPLRVWLCGLIVLIAINYQVAYSGYGVPLKLVEAILLAAVTVLLSIAAFMPNGFGVLDALWVWVAHSQGLSFTEAVSVALVMRIGFLCSAGLIWALLSMRKINPSAGA